MCLVGSLWRLLSIQVDHTTIVRSATITILVHTQWLMICWIFVSKPESGHGETMTDRADKKSKDE